MKITRILLWHKNLTSSQPYHMAEGKTCDTVETVVVRVDTDAGISGWGEVCPIPHYLPAYARGVAPAIVEMAPVLLGENPVGADVLTRKLDSWLIGHEYAKSALNIAFWDITGKVANLPLFSLFGGLQNAALPLYHSVTCIEPDEMVRIAVEAHKTGIRQIQVKLGADNDWPTDVERLTKIREAMPVDVLVYGDWNCGADKLTATRVGRAVAHLDVMLEQPCATIEQCADVRAATGLPMKLDENIHDIASLIKAAQAGCMDAVAIKTSKFGGLSRARQARDLCQTLGVKMCIEDTWGSDIITAAALHLGAASETKFLMNVCDLSSYVSPRLDASLPGRKDGHIAPPQGIGLGVNPDPGSPDQVIE